ncbi:hypothetical protein CBR_g12484 [Chara braunii]|uniref:Uncharacterized protein n=1 Tax=Chara braunii TaxID=69332 RepID=A0A388JSG8_CHABU|nr:hypothetical protein CBR_g12484 [Chara braunii]|eukprot:GBG60746.1 hypothetical protein CBR_g12484 [Chara braunii]
MVGWLDTRTVRLLGVGLQDGRMSGRFVAGMVGWFVGGMVGWFVGGTVRREDGREDGRMGERMAGWWNLNGRADGGMVGYWDGGMVGRGTAGWSDVRTVRWWDGWMVCWWDGGMVGWFVGGTVRREDGREDGKTVGWQDGGMKGWRDGGEDGNQDGGMVVWQDGGTDQQGRWAGPSFALEPCSLKLNLDNRDFIKGHQGVSALVEEWRDERPKFEKHEDWKRQLKTSRLEYWEKELDMFNQLKTEKNSEPIPLSTSFWPSPMTESVEELKVELPVVDSPPRKQCFVGYKSDAPKPEFDPTKHVDVGCFVVMRASDENVEKGVSFWVGRVQEISQDSEKILVQYWNPQGKETDMYKLYEDA